MNITTYKIHLKKTWFGKVKNGFGILGLGLLCTSPALIAAPGQDSEGFSTQCGIQNAGTQFNVPDRFQGNDSLFAATLALDNGNGVNGGNSVGSLVDDSYYFVIPTDTLPTFPVVQPPLGDLADEVPATDPSEVRYLIAGGNSLNLICVYSYNLTSAGVRSNLEILSTTTNPVNVPLFTPFGLVAIIGGLLWFGRRRKAIKLIQS